MSKFDPYEHLNISFNDDGTLTRYVQFPRCAATGDPPEIPGQSVISKDLPLNTEKNTSLRMYRPAKLPSNDNNVARLPIIFHFHGGAWVFLSAKETMIHEHSNRVSSEVPAIVIAVEFRLPPEHRLPAQYEDAVEAVNWARKQAIGDNGEPWIKEYGDINRCYLYGCSSGANIAFNAALRLLDINVEPLKIAGTIMNQPFFGGKQRTRSELKMATDQYFPLPALDLLWELALPVGTDRNHRYCNPFADGPMRDKVREMGRCLVIGFGGDPMIDRQQEFVQMMMNQGGLVEARFDDVGFHGIDLIDPRRAIAIVNFIKDFIY